ncbi:hypothetical protein [Aeromonas enteropelogenes]|uniref:hypothetical protein n=1 Tax=Aeromonas enteropelogenes TaxID=29489 RepID=UPI003BA37E13
MPYYHFFKQGQALTYLDANAPSYGDERGQLIEQGFAPLAAPTFADSPAAALAQLQSQEEMENAPGAHDDFYVANSHPATIAGVSGV